MDREEISHKRRKLCRQRMAQEMPNQREERRTRRRKREKEQETCMLIFRTTTSTTAATKRYVIIGLVNHWQEVLRKWQSPVQAPSNR